MGDESDVGVRDVHINIISTNTVLYLIAIFCVATDDGGDDDGHQNLHCP